MPPRPVCSLCVADCDANGVLTSCQHFVCGRCAAKHASDGQCPRCQRACQRIRLGASNFPKDLMERITNDPQRLLASAAQALEFQRRQESQTVQRLKELVSASGAAARSFQEQLTQARKEIDSLQQQLRRERDLRKDAERAAAAPTHDGYSRQLHHQPYHQPNDRRQRSAESIAGESVCLGASALGGYTPARASPSSVRAVTAATPAWGHQLRGSGGASAKRLREDNAGCVVGPGDSVGRHPTRPSDTPVCSRQVATPRGGLDLPPRMSGGSGPGAGHDGGGAVVRRRLPEFGCPSEPGTFVLATPGMTGLRGGGGGGARERSPSILMLDRPSARRCDITSAAPGVDHLKSLLTHRRTL